MEAAAAAATIVGTNGGAIILRSQRFTSCFLSLYLPSNSLTTTVSTLNNQTSLLLRPRTKTLLSKRLSAADSTQSSPSVTTTASDKSIVSDNDFTLAKVSFGVIGLGLGVSLLSYGFGAYFNILPGSEWSAIMLTYGFPLAIIGMALKYAELKPVPCVTYSDAELLREKCATDILKQVEVKATREEHDTETNEGHKKVRKMSRCQGGCLSLSGLWVRKKPIEKQKQSNLNNSTSPTFYLINGC